MALYDCKGRSGELKIIYTTSSAQSTVADKLAAIKTAFDNLSQRDKMRAVIIQNGVDSLPMGAMFINTATPGGRFIGYGITDDTQMREDVIDLSNGYKLYRYTFTTSGITIVDFSSQTPQWDFCLAVV